MDYLWTPWRYQYVVEGVTPLQCVFCAAAEAKDDHDPLIVHRGEFNFVLLNRFPYTNGHVMVAPYEHRATLEALDDAPLLELIRLTRDCEKLLRAAYKPDGLNVGINIGKSAGAGIAGHLHVHVLPRWAGDTNFMTVTAETRVLPETLDLTWERLRKQWASFGPQP